MSDLRIKGVLNVESEPLSGILNSTSSPLSGVLNLYTLEVGDGRDIELGVIGGYLAWRRVNDTEWIGLVTIESITGKTPVKGVDYWTESDIATIQQWIETRFYGTYSPFVRSPKEEFPAIGSVDRIYIDSNTQYVYHWDPVALVYATNAINLADINRINGGNCYG